MKPPMGGLRAWACTLPLPLPSPPPPPETVLERRVAYAHVALKEGGPKAAAAGWTRLLLPALLLLAHAGRATMAAATAGSSAHEASISTLRIVEPRAAVDVSDDHSTRHRAPRRRG